MLRALGLFFIVVPLFFMAGCGSQSQVASNPTSTPAAATAPVGLSVTDTPPTGVTVLFFQLNITGATLTSSSAGGNVSLLPSSGSIPVNVTQLQTDTAFLGSANVAAGEYTGLNLTFSNPQLTIYNGSNAAIGSGPGACAVNAVCQITPSASSLSLSFTTAPFPVDLTASSPLAFLLDINLNTVIQSGSSGLTVNLGATNGVTISQLPAPQAGTPIPHLGHLTGTIQSINSSTTPNDFVLQTLDGRTFTIDVGSSTTYNYPNAVCTTDNLACLATQQVVKVEVTLPSGGTLTASEVDYVQPAGQTSVEGNIIRLSTSGSNTLMDLILQQGPGSSSTLPLGRRVTVTVPSTATFAIDSDSFTLPGGLSFASVTDLIAGQEVTVVVVPGSLTTTAQSGNPMPWVGGGGTTFTTSSVTLEPSQITGSVGAVNQGAMSFTLATLPNFFVPPSANSNGPSWAPVNITVQTTGSTTFTDFTTDSIQGLAVNDFVSVGGWVFATPGGGPPAITVAAETVLDRPGPTPLF